MAQRKRKSPLPARAKAKQPRSEEQSGSTGRRTAEGPQKDKDSGQDRYGQSGFSGRPTETEGQARYRQSGKGPAGKARSGKGVARGKR